MDALYTALSGIMAQTGALNQVSGNIANQMSSGYLAQVGQVVDGIQQSVLRVGPQGTQTIGTISSGVVYTNSVNTSASPIQSTGVPTDLAVSGNGFFAVQTPIGVQYTRNGAFSLNPQGQLVNPLGNPLLDVQQKPLRVNPHLPFQVSSAGVVTQNGRQVGAIGLYQMPAPSLVATSGGLYQSRAARLAGPGVAVVQGSVDGANVSLARSAQDLIRAQSGYQSLTTLVNAESKRMSIAVGLGILA
jgi:flagellar basal body rod protein FlgG